MNDDMNDYLEKYSEEECLKYGHCGCDLRYYSCCYCGYHYEEYDEAYAEENSI